MKKIIFYCSFLGLFCCCKKEHVDPELVFHSHISPQQPMTTVYVGLVDHVDGTKDKYNEIDVKGQAIVSILGNSTLYKLEYDAASNLYVIDSTKLKIKAGSTYTLIVAVKDKKSSASTTIPVLNNSIIYTTDSIMGSNYELHASWQDTPDSNSAYQLEITYLTLGATTYYAQTNSMFVSDILNPGGLITAKLSFEYIHLPNQTVTATLSVLSPEYSKWLYKTPKSSTGHGPTWERNLFVGLNSYTVQIKP